MADLSNKLASLFGLALTLFILGLASFGALQSCSERWINARCEGKAMCDQR